MKIDIRYWLRDYFGFSRRETNGFLVLSVMLLILLFIPLTYPLFQVTKTLSTQDQQHLDSLLALLPPPPNTTTYLSSPNNTPSGFSSQALFPFDPNTASYETLVSLGFSSKVANNLIKYRSKGAKFYKPSQIERIYGMDKAFFEKIAPYLQFPNAYSSRDKSTSYQKNKYNHSSKKKDARYASESEEQKTDESVRRTYTSPRIEAFDLNQADALTLKQVRGIGETLSVRIVAYREKLGGFVSLNQLSEVYGLTPEAVEELKKYAQINTGTSVRQMAINQIDANTLSKHPYINAKKAQTLINYRLQHGRFENLDALKKVKSIDAQTLEKLAPYLTFE